MWHALIAALSMLALAAPLEAQSVRIDVGRTSSGVSWDHPPPPPSATGAQIVSGSSNTDRRSYTVAALVRSDLTRWFAAESGFRLVPKGFEVTGPTFHMLYGEVPVVGVIQSGPRGGIFVEGGIVVGFRLQCRRFMETVAGPHEDGCGAATTDYGRDLEPLRRSDLSWVLGLGGRIPVGKGRIILSARVERSLVDIQPDHEHEKMVNRVGMLVIGYEWTLGLGMPGRVRDGSRVARVRGREARAANARGFTRPLARGAGLDRVWKIGIEGGEARRPPFALVRSLLLWLVRQ